MPVDGDVRIVRARQIDDGNRAHAESTSLPDPTVLASVGADAHGHVVQNGSSSDQRCAFGSARRRAVAAPRMRCVTAGWF